MTKHVTQPIYSLLLVVTFFTSCNGQTKTPTDQQSETITNLVEQPKLIKTQGSTESDNIHCILQDNLGNIWFGTTGEGVYRFDGKLFTQFTKEDGLSSNCLYSILEDKEGNIWFGTSNGICRYDGKIIIPVTIPIDIRPVITNNNYYSQWSTKNTVWSMLQDKTGKIWFGTGDGVYCYKENTFTRFLDHDEVINKDNLHLKMIECIFEDKTGNIWFASGCPPGSEGLIRYDGKEITSSKPNGDSWIRYINEDKQGRIWFGGRINGNFFYDGNKFTIFTEKTGIGNPILTDASGNIWFNGEEKLSTVESAGGIWCYDGKVFKNYNGIDGMNKYAVWSMFQDKNGNIWIGTRNTGLYKFDGETFTNYSE